jgi:hypothetical protein
MQRPLQEVILRALTVGCPPIWEDVPEESQGALATLDRLEDEALWRLSHLSFSQFEGTDRSSRSRLLLLLSDE